MSNCLILDIETLPNDLNENMEFLLNKKVQNELEEKKERRKLEYRFHEPPYARVCSISTIWSSDGESISREETFFSRNDERKVIEEFITYISKFSGVFVHYNGLDFDVPFILAKCALYGIDPPQRFCNLIRFRTNPHYDIMQVYTAWGRFRVNLAELLITFGISNSKDVLQGKDTLAFLLEASDEDIQKYNMEDVRSTFELYKRINKVFK